MAVNVQALHLIARQLMEPFLTRGRTITEDALPMSGSPNVTMRILVDVDDQGTYVMDKHELVFSSIITIDSIHRTHPQRATAVHEQSVCAGAGKLVFHIIMTHLARAHIQLDDTVRISTYPQVITIHAQGMDIILREDIAMRKIHELTVRLSETTQSAIVRRYPHMSGIIFAESRNDIAMQAIMQTITSRISLETVGNGRKIIDPTIERTVPKSALMVAHHRIDKPIADGGRSRAIVGNHLP